LLRFRDIVFKIKYIHGLLIYVRYQPPRCVLSYATEIHMFASNFITVLFNIYGVMLSLNIVT